MQPHIQMPLSHIMPVTWSSSLTVKHLSCQKPMHAVVPGDIFSCPTTHHPPQQRSSTNHSSNHKCSHVLSFRSRNQHIIHQLPWGCPCTSHTGILGTYSTTLTNTNRQHYGIWRGQQQCHEKAQNNGHEIPLAPRRHPNIILALLSTRKKQ